MGRKDTDIVNNGLNSFSANHAFFLPDIAQQIIYENSKGIITCCLENFKGEYFDIFFVKYDKIQV
ncbi:hypothetical protein C6499_15690 [Candidatus Poribacteria bacterium]|nr:MAG: hypothetical protein C6499_15690 [Candidatus Poribacteria bacterium]